MRLLFWLSNFGHSTKLNFQVFFKFITSCLKLSKLWMQNDQTSESQIPSETHQDQYLW